MNDLVAEYQQYQEAGIDDEVDAGGDKAAGDGAQEAPAETGATETAQEAEEV